MVSINCEKEERDKEEEKKDVEEEEEKEESIFQVARACFRG